MKPRLKKHSAVHCPRMASFVAIPLRILPYVPVAMKCCPSVMHSTCPKNKSTTVPPSYWKTIPYSYSTGITPIGARHPIQRRCKIVSALRISVVILGVPVFPPTTLSPPLPPIGIVPLMKCLSICPDAPTPSASAYAGRYFPIILNPDLRLLFRPDYANRCPFAPKSGYNIVRHLSSGLDATDEAFLLVKRSYCPPTKGQARSLSIDGSDDSQ